ncbi:bifunctional metallophosphatase/5'-nucleotidase [Sabulicella rubraurantiaca]|uniref:bifunctional metallophosphatase/5'-nucleotidase n=1 Tax=Sabulicella rubraurantiaca TaxID=2811429 RepID=UPI001A956BB9|nr:5'-nucleotidase C-terminal domain-containing protein [Sabulicella rubraurantiaca]
MLSRRLFLAAPFVLRPAFAQSPAARVALLHLNDFHSRHEPVTAGAANCAGGDSCLGGSARMATAIREAREAARADGRASLLLDAGDEFLGSLFFREHQGMAEARMQRLWGVQAMAPGNHEFDLGPAALARYLEAVDFPVLAANLETAAEPALAGKLRPTVTFRSGAARLVIAGLVTPDTPNISSPGPHLRFTDPAEAASRAVWEARREGAATVVVLSHLGLGADRRLARDVPGIDVIIGGHSHTLVAPPETVEAGERRVLIVQAKAFGQYLGRLDLDLGPEGQVVQSRQAMRLLDVSVPEDEEALALVRELAEPLEALRRRVAFRLDAAVPLQGCGTGPCALGAAVARTMREAAGAEIGWQNAGGIRAGLPAGEVSWGDLLTALPFSNTLAVMVLRGHAVRDALENGVSRLPQPSGRFPQLDGLRFEADAARPVGQRILRAEVREADGTWRPLEPERTYRVATNDFLRRGGDGYESFAHALEARDDGPPLEDAVAARLGG